MKILKSKPHSIGDFFSQLKSHTYILQYTNNIFLFLSILDYTKTLQIDSSERERNCDVLYIHGENQW